MENLFVDDLFILEKLVENVGKIHKSVMNFQDTLARINYQGEPS